MCNQLEYLQLVCVCVCLDNISAASPSVNKKPDHVDVTWVSYRTEKLDVCSLDGFRTRDNLMFPLLSEVRT